MTTANAIDVHALAARVTAGVERGDFALLELLFSPQLRVWHNFDQTFKPWTQVRQGLEGLQAQSRTLKFEEIRVTEFQGGWLQQHRLHVVFKDGTERNLYAALIYRIDETGLVTSMEEYFDPAQMTNARAP
jgi:hypothetical protein